MVAQSSQPSSSTRLVTGVALPVRLEPRKIMTTRNLNHDALASCCKSPNVVTHSSPAFLAHAEHEEIATGLKRRACMLQPL
eukprot:3898885-Amphidinium_carterae.1